MKSNMIVCAVVGLGLAVGVSGCRPDKMELEIYTADIQKASTATVVEVPMTATFSIMGEDTNGDLPKASEVAKRYLDEKTEFKMSKGSFGDVMVVKCTIPMGTADALKTYLAGKQRPFALTIKDGTVVFGRTQHLKTLNQDLGGINPMLDVDVPAKSTVLRLVGDTETAPEITAIAVFVDKKPELVFRKKLERRSSVDVDFKGEEASVYSEISPQFTIKF